MNRREFLIDLGVKSLALGALALAPGEIPLTADQKALVNCTRFVADSATVREAVKSFIPHPLFASSERLMMQFFPPETDRRLLRAKFSGYSAFQDLPLQVRANYSEEDVIRRWTEVSGFPRVETSQIPWVEKVRGRCQVCPTEVAIEKSEAIYGHVDDSHRMEVKISDYFVWSNGEKTALTAEKQLQVFGYVYGHESAHIFDIFQNPNLIRFMPEAKLRELLKLRVDCLGDVSEIIHSPYHPIVNSFDRNRYMQIHAVVAGDIANNSPAELRKQMLVYPRRFYPPGQRALIYSASEIPPFVFFQNQLENLFGASAKEELGLGPKISLMEMDHGLQNKYLGTIWKKFSHGGRYQFSEGHPWAKVVFDNYPGAIGQEIQRWSEKENEGWGQFINFSIFLGLKGVDLILAGKYTGDLPEQLVARTIDDISTLESEYFAEVVGSYLYLTSGFEENTSREIIDFLEKTPQVHYFTRLIKVLGERTISQLFRLSNVAGISGNKISSEAVGKISSNLEGRLISTNRLTRSWGG